MTVGVRVSRCIAALGGFAILSGCVASTPKPLPVTTLPTTSTTIATVDGSTPVVASAACKAAFQQGHDAEGAGTETFAAFRPSIQKCSSAAEWIAAAKNIGVDLGNQSLVFIDRTCSLADAPTRARAICQEVKGKDGAPPAG